MTRALYRRENNHVLLTGARGVGKTSLVWELARRAAGGDIPFLGRKRFLWVDCRNVAPGESKEKLQALLAQTAGRSDLIVCLDGLGALLKTETGDNKHLLRAALKDGRVHVIGVMSDADLEHLLANDHELLDYFTRVPVEEPKRDAAIAMVRQAAAGLTKEYKTTFGENAIERAVVLSMDYILNERLPAKAIRILSRACDEIDYQRTQAGSARTEVTAADVIRIVSDISGVPEGTLSGAGEKTNYEASLGASVVGQDEAVRAVATELRLIKAGLTDPGKPASVLLFAGLTGVGKTELAKTLAQFYSSSKRLQVYAMGNFTEPHSVSGIIGSPVGYQGHEQGGRLINDLNADPYGVFLLDEAEKAHPEVWKPFLNLFDEGWVEDQRGVKAFADRAIFILTSNAGAEEISRMAPKDGPVPPAIMRNIVEAVREQLPKVMHSVARQPVFTPEFLARIRRIIIFCPLTEAAMEGICRKILAKIGKSWKEKREKTLEVPDNLIRHIAKESHKADVNSGYKEGGRIVRKLISDLVEARIQNAAAEHEKDYDSHNHIRLTFVGGAVAVEFIDREEVAAGEHLAKAAEAVEKRMESGAPGAAQAALREIKARLEAARTRAEAGEATDQFWRELEAIEEQAGELGRRTGEQERALLAALLATLRRGCAAAAHAD